MQFYYPGILYIGIPSFAAFYLLLRFIVKKKGFIGGVKAANSAIIRENPLFKRRMLVHKITSIIIELLLVVSVLSSFVLLARPHKQERLNQGVRKRDIFLCMDNGVYLDNLNSELIDEMIELVKSLDGDRFGVSIFCSASLLYVPMTDDYGYIVQKLEELKEYFELVVRLDQVYGAYGADLPDALPAEMREDFSKDYERYMDLYQEMIPATYLNSYIKGHFLVGDGLASCMYSFPKFGAEDRSRIVLLSTENTIEIGSDPILTLDEAARLCDKNDVTVFGLFRGEKAFSSSLTPNNVFLTSMYTDTDYESAKADLEANVSMTGGKVYEYGVMSVADIVADIKKQPAMLVDEVVISKRVDQPKLPFTVLCVSLIGIAVCVFVREI